MLKNFLVGFLVVYLITSQAAHYKKVVVQDKDAVCLDGSPGVYYISQGKSTKKFMIFFEGGGWCGDVDLPSTIENCYQRSLTDLGSSKKYPESFAVYDGILSQRTQNSYSDFTKVFFKYCDGSGHQGTRTNPIDYKNTKIYFRGNNLTISKLNHLQQNYGLFSKSTQILVTGISAGGLATFVWADYIHNKSISKNVYAVPDSGIFLDSQNFHSHQSWYRNTFANLFKLSNVQINPPVPQCVKWYQKQPYRCMLAQNLHRFIQTPLFAVQSLYDTWSLYYILGVRCQQSDSLKNCTGEELAYIEDYHRNTSRVLEEIAAKPQHGYWAPSCLNHGYTWTHYYTQNYAIPMKTKNTVDFTVFPWSQKQPGNHRHMDRGNWPQNQPCSNYLATNIRSQ